MGYSTKKNHIFSIFSQEKWCEVHPSSCTGPRQGCALFFSCAIQPAAKLQILIGPSNMAQNQVHYGWFKLTFQYFAPSIVTGWPTPIYQWMMTGWFIVENSMIIWMMTGKYWLVVSTYPSEKWWSSSVGMIVPSIWKNQKLFQTPNQHIITFRGEHNIVKPHLWL